MRLFALLAVVAVPGFLYAQRGSILHPGGRGFGAPATAAPQNGFAFGNILYPGGTPNNAATNLSGSIGGGLGFGGVFPGGFGGIGPGGFGGIGHGGHHRNRTLVVPYAVPLFYGGGGYYPTEPQSTNVTVVVPQQAVPQVIINNSYSPDTARPVMREYSPGELPETSNVRPPRETSEPAQPRRSVLDEKATIYLIALKDGTIRQALGYWVKDDVFHYVTPASSVNHVSVGMVDRERSIELNAERNLEFDLKFMR